MADVLGIGRQIIDLLSTGQYTAAHERFDKTMSELMPPDAVEAAWQQILGQAGNLVEVSDRSATKEDGYDVALYECRFELGDLMCRLVFDSSERLAGLHFYPGDAA